MSGTVIRVEETTTIGRPIGEVFERLTALPRHSEWMPGTGLFGGTRIIDREVEEGARYQDDSRIGPWRGEFAELDRPTRVAFRQTLRWFGLDVMEARLAYLLANEDGRTELQHAAEAELFGVFRSARPVAASLAKRERRLVVGSLKRSLEQAILHPPDGSG